MNKVNCILSLHFFSHENFELKLVVEYGGSAVTVANKLKFLVKSYMVKCCTRIIKHHGSTSITNMQRVENN